ncbi:hypothetical protein ACKUSY_11905 [Myroides odoratus]
MFFNSKRLQERKEGLTVFDSLVKEKKTSVIIHYSCESFFVTHGRTPRITSICLRFLSTEQTKSYSIHLQAQFEGLDFNNLTNTQFDCLEKKMLDEFFRKVEYIKDYNWVHWNMRDSNYGFEAINNRYKILGGVPIEIHEDKRSDLPRILSLIYSENYAEHGEKGKLLTLAENNDITSTNALPGAEEADAFKSKEFLKLHASTLRKVDVMSAIITKVNNNKLITKSKLIDIYGITPIGIQEIIQNNWILKALVSLILFILGVIANPYILGLF